MKYRRLASTGVYVSELCLGAMTFGGTGVFQAIGALGQSEADALVHRAIDGGINFFDTATSIPLASLKKCSAGRWELVGRMSS